MAVAGAWLCTTAGSASVDAVSGIVATGSRETQRA